MKTIVKIVLLCTLALLLSSCGVRKPVTKATVTNGAEGTTTTITISVKDDGNTNVSTTPSVNAAIDSTNILSTPKLN